MKSKIIFCILIMHVLYLVNACKPKESEPGPAKVESSQFAKLKIFEVTDNPNNLRLIGIDSISKTTLMLFGKPKSKITKIAILNQKTILTTLDFDEANFYPVKYTVTSEKASISVSILKVNQANNTIEIEAKDELSGNVIPQKSITVSKDEMSKLISAESSFKNDLKTARVSSTTCVIANIALRIVKDIACVLSVMALPEVTLLCNAVVPPGNAVCVSTYTYTVVETCSGVLDPIPTECQPYNEPYSNLPADCIAAILSKRIDPGCANGIAQTLLQVLSNLESPANTSGHSWGDPHLTTFDGLAYDFQAWGEFIAVKSTTDKFEVQVRQEGIGNGRISFNRGFAVQTGQDVVCWVEKKLYINNILTNTNFTSLPLKEGASLSITKDKRNNNVLNIKSKYGDLVTVPVNSFDYAVKLSEVRQGKIMGLLGDFDGNKENDLKMKNNEVVTLESVKTSGISVKVPFSKLYPTFADNWRIEQKNSLFYYESNKNTESFTKRNYPQGPIELTEEKRAWATGICKAAGIDKEPYLSACIIDVAQTDDPNMASASLWMQQNQLKSNTLQVATESDINHFKNVKVTISESQGNLEDSCLVSFSTGQVFQLKDGAKYANLIDGLFLNYCGLSLNTPQNIITCGFSCGVSRMNSVLVAQKWNKYRRGTIEFIGFASDDKPSDPNRVASSTWDFILTSNDIEKSFEKHYGSFTTTNTFSSTNVVQTASNCVPTLFIDKTLRRFLTEDGKKGVIKFTNWGRGKSGWWVEFDIKIQK